MKAISKLVLIFFLSLGIFLIYISIYGIETNKFNTHIEKKIKDINKNLEIELREIKIVLNPFKLKLNLKTVGPTLKNKGKIIEIEYLKTQISLISFLDDSFSIENLDVSTKSLQINNLISFTRSIINTPQLFILEKIVKDGYLIGNIKIEFDKEGKIKDNYKIKGFVRDVKFSLIKKYNFNKLNFIFDYKKNDILLENILFTINNLNISSSKTSIKKVNDKFNVKGNFENKEFDFNKKDLELFIKPFLPNLEVDELKFSSKSNFSFKFNKDFKFKDIDITSDILVNNLLISNNLNLKNFFPKNKDDIQFSKNELKIKYKKGDFSINGSGSLLIQENKDYIEYSFEKTNSILKFKSLLKIKDNLLNINFLNFEKDQNAENIIEIEGIKVKEQDMKINSFSIKEKNNLVSFENLLINDEFKIISLGKVNLDYFDKQKQKNLIKINKKNDEYFLTGSSFNANNLISSLLNSKDNNFDIVHFNNKINVLVDKIYLDNEYFLRNFNGNLFLKGSKIINANLNGNFTDDKNLQFTVITKNSNKVTTLFSDKAEPLVKRYKFVKGFDEGSLDFYNSKDTENSISTLKIYDFKLKELPVLTKILTLASLQGIADILSGEGIRFNEFEMKFKSKENLMTIDEIYAIGPAISIMMDGYVEKDKLISLRGTLVPATTINKFIGSLPVLGKILVGKKTGEGVFGVSFKIKGPPKDLEATVNPIKTLTPRFITRTLEKLKKN